MQKFLFIYILLFTSAILAQKPELAYSYYRNGEYNKAIMLYKPLHEKNKIRQDYFKYLLTSYQQTENFNEAQTLIEQQQIDFVNLKYLYVELGYNYQLQNNYEKANENYEKALSYVKENSNYVYSIGKSFRDNYLLDYALNSYETALALNPKLNVQIQLAQIYGEKGELNKMFNTYLDLIEKDEKYYPTIQRYMGQFVDNNPNNEANLLLKKILIQRSQNNPQDAYNTLLSWLYIQQNEYSKAFVQEKSIYIRNQGDFEKIIEIGVIAFSNEDFHSTKRMFEFVLENSNDATEILQAEDYLIRSKIKLASSKQEYSEINEQFYLLLDKYGWNNSTLNLQITYADFLTFYYNQPEEAIAILDKAQKYSNSAFENGLIKIKQADILVFTNQFNQALILYSQVQSKLKNSTLGQSARFKVAQTSYFKGDFEWAQTQLKVLKSSTSQLIANDALDLSLLISNNIENDSLEVGLKTYAKAELLSYQNKTQQAIDSLNFILTNYKGQSIEDETLFKQAELYTQLNEFEMAKNNYLKLIDNYPQGILIDDTYYELAKLYQNELLDLEKAKEFYEKIIFDFPSSIYLIESRKQYRILRGDNIN